MSLSLSGLSTRESKQDLCVACASLLSSKQRWENDVEGGRKYFDVDELKRYRIRLERIVNSHPHGYPSSTAGGKHIGFSPICDGGRLKAWSIGGMGSERTIMGGDWQATLPGFGMVEHGHLCLHRPSSARLDGGDCRSAQDSSHRISHPAAKKHAGKSGHSLLLSPAAVLPLAELML